MKTHEDKTKIMWAYNKCEHEIIGKEMIHGLWKGEAEGESDRLKRCGYGWFPVQWTNKLPLLRDVLPSTNRQTRTIIVVNTNMLPQICNRMIGIEREKTRTRIYKTKQKLFTTEIIICYY